MNKRPGHVNVTTEVSFCNFCGRTRNLRREEHQLGQLVRSIVTCETCHRTLSSTIGVATAPEPEPAQVETPPTQPAAVIAERPRPKATRPAVKKPAAKKPAAKAKAPAKKTPPKPRSTATRQTSKKK